MKNFIIILTLVVSIMVAILVYIDIPVVKNTNISENKTTSTSKIISNKTASKNIGIQFYRKRESYKTNADNNHSINSSYIIKSGDVSLKLYGGKVDFSSGDKIQLHIIYGNKNEKIELPSLSTGSLIFGEIIIKNKKIVLDKFLMENFRRNNDITLFIDPKTNKIKMTSIKKHVESLKSRPTLGDLPSFSYLNE